MSRNKHLRVLYLAKLLYEETDENHPLSTCQIIDRIHNMEVAINHVFFSWVFGFSGSVRILSPDPIREEYETMLRQALNEK